MTRAPKTNRVPRPRCGGRWTEAAYWGFLRSGLRQLSRKWQPISDVKKLARRPYVGPNRRRKWEYQCAQCREWFADKETEIDHVVPIGRILCYEDLGPAVAKMFCEADGLRVLCHVCNQSRKSPLQSEIDNGIISRKETKT